MAMTVAPPGSAMTDWAITDPLLPSNTSNSIAGCSPATCSAAVAARVAKAVTEPALMPWNGDRICEVTTEGEDELWSARLGGSTSWSVELH